MTAPSRSYKVALNRDGDMSAIPVPFDPKTVFGKIRAPVLVTVNGYQYRSTISSMGGYWVPLRKSHREAAGLRDDHRAAVAITLTLDTAPRTVELPADLRAALVAVPAAWQRWQALSYSHQREHVEAVEQAKQAVTRQRRIAKAVEMLRAAPRSAARR